MGAKPYPTYKDSGVEWIGEIPEHWEVKRLKDVAEGMKAGPFGSALTKDVYVSEGYRVYGQEQVIPNDFTVGDYYITPNKYDELSQYRVTPGDILISCVGTFGKIALVPKGIAPGIINPRLIRLRCGNSVLPEYLLDFMRSTVTFEQLSSTSRGGTMDIINIGTLSGIRLALPPKVEQLDIIEFLDRETSKIDTLIGKQQQLINLLKEKRGSLISHTVTKGLNPNAPMKDSGVEWIGEIPEHWEVRKVGNVSRLLSTAESYGDYTVALENIEPWTGNFVFTESEYASNGVPFESGDVLFGKLRPYLAKVYLANSSGLAIGDLFTLRTTNSQAPEFFALWLRCKSFIDIVDGLTYGAKMPRVSFSQFKVLPIPSPPLEEQKHIASFLDRETSKIDTLIEKANQSIALLKERRSSLISAAVTGKIDVREAA